MDITWVTKQLGVGGGIWTEAKMSEIARAGITHVIDMQIEFDDTPIAAPFGIRVLWNPTDDDFQPKSPELFQRGVEFALEALEDLDNKLLIHCAAGVHRAPMMTLAVMASLGWDMQEAMDRIQDLRPTVDFADVYVDSVRHYLRQRDQAGMRDSTPSR